ncbi:hypothetical protein ZWY2020_054683 [Hordeum vulgare]|nr:hypothetical protein ZWY2020_054683 [Hordeum vulgare]
MGLAVLLADSGGLAGVPQTCLRCLSSTALRTRWLRGLLKRAQAEAEGKTVRPRSQLFYNMVLTMSLTSSGGC